MEFPTEPSPVVGLHLAERRAGPKSPADTLTPDARSVKERELHGQRDSLSRRLKVHVLHHAVVPVGSHPSWEDSLPRPTQIVAHERLLSVGSGYFRFPRHHLPYHVGSDMHEK